MKQILAFVLFAGLLCWMMFAPVYKHVILMRHALLQKEVDYLLEVGANGSYGFVDEAAVDASRDRLASHGFRSDRLEYVVTATNGANAANPASPVQRGAGIMLAISYPYEGMFAIDRLIGMLTPADDARMVASGMKMSEYVP